PRGLGGRRRGARGGPHAAQGRGGAGSTRRGFWRGLITNGVKPKVALFTVALVPQFVEPARGQVPAQFLVLGAVFVALEIVVDGTVGLSAGGVRRVLARRPRAARGLDVASGSVFVGLAAKLALTRCPQPVRPSPFPSAS